MAGNVRQGTVICIKDCASYFSPGATEEPGKARIYSLRPAWSLFARINGRGPGPAITHHRSKARFLSLPFPTQCETATRLTPIPSPHLVSPSKPVGVVVTATSPARPADVCCGRTGEARPLTAVYAGVSRPECPQILIWGMGGAEAVLPRATAVR